jgi:hypothetical protein
MPREHYLFAVKSMPYSYDTQISRLWEEKKIRNEKLMVSVQLRTWTSHEIFLAHFLKYE